MAIDNFELIKPLLTFEEKGDFYMLYIFLRKKDHKEDVSSNHQSVRTIKSYCIYSIEKLEQRWEEIKMLCEIFKARAYIHVQAQNNATVGLNMIEEIAKRLKNGDNNFQSIFDSVVGQIKVREKRWVVDIDTHNPVTRLECIQALKDIIPVGNKIITEIPTKNGLHFITIPFNVQEFRNFGWMIEIQKKNPTVLYIPNSLL